MSQEWQLDIIRGFPQTWEVPTYVKGRLSADDFIFVNYPSDMNPNLYTVAVESSQTRDSIKYRSIGKLQSQLQLPNVYFSPYAKIMFLPVSDKLPSFYSKLVRGGTYHIPKVSRNGEYQINVHGIH